MVRTNHPNHPCVRAWALQLPISYLGLHTGLLSPMQVMVPRVQHFSALHLKSDQDLRMDVPVSHRLYSTFTLPRPHVHSIYSKTFTPDQPSSELYNRQQDQNQKWPQDSTDKDEFPSQQDLQPSLCSQGVTVKRHTQQEGRDVLCSGYLTEKDLTNFHQCREIFHSKFNCTLQVRQPQAGVCR